MGNNPVGLSNLMRSVENSYCVIFLFLPGHCDLQEAWILEIYSAGDKYFTLFVGFSDDWQMQQPRITQVLNFKLLKIIQISPSRKWFVVSLGN